MTDMDFPDALPPGSRLHWYVLERVLGQGGFGITYLAHDTNLDRRVAIKEYLPTEIARRRSDASARPHTESQSERYAWGLDRFLAEARTLARFDHPNIVRVLSVFEANNTAYMVMRFEEGEDLATLLERRGTLPEAQLTSCLMPILDGLRLVHASGFIHRDIKPENIYVRQDGSPVLLDFGSARQSFGSAKTMTILVAPGYAPLEQYYGDASTQGPWTDIYGLGATCYRAISGEAPLDAVARAKGVLGSAREILKPAQEAGRGRYGEALLAAVDHSLQLSEKDRPQTIEEWRRELAVTAAPLPPAPVMPAQGVPLAINAPSTLPIHVDTTAPAAAVASTPSGVEIAAPGSLPADFAATAHGKARRSSAAVAIVVALLVLGTAVALVTGRPPSPTLASVDTRPVATAPAPAAAPTSSPKATAPAQPMAGEATAGGALIPALQPHPAALSPLPVAANPPVVVESRGPVDAVQPRDVAGRDSPGRPNPGSGTVETLRAAGAAPARTAPGATAPGTVIATPAVNLAAGSSPPAAIPAATQATSGTAAIQAARIEPAPTRSLREEQLDAAEAALRRGEAAAAAQMLAPLAAAGNARAQVLLGRAQEAKPLGQQNDFEAYVWYGIAARNGQTGAQSMRDKVGGRLQPAEIHQAEQIIDRWKPRAEPAGERATP